MAQSFPTNSRYDRGKSEVASDKRKDCRTAPQHDRDRILYSSAFRRLAGVTQVVAADEGHVFHNRLTHSIEVAQFGRRLAEKLLIDRPELGQEENAINPDIVEAAALAHDLGHPPFGHVAEQELNGLVKGANVSSGFEGNAQSFRIVTKLALRSEETIGLNLTRATLNGILKYPWLEGGHSTQKLKWGAYDTEAKELEWTRQMEKPGDHRKSAEASLMDWADDVTYAVHDAADFYRAGLIPLDRLASVKDDSERERFFQEVFDRHREAGMPLRYEESAYATAFRELIRYLPMNEAYKGTRVQRGELRRVSSFFINRYINAITIPAVPSAGTGERAIKIDAELEKEVFMLKQLTWHYVILNPGLATQQFGQRKIIRGLFEMFVDAATNKRDLLIFPFAFKEQLGEHVGNDKMTIRIVADRVSGLTEQHAISLYHRLSGISLGSVMDLAGRS